MKRPKAAKVRHVFRCGPSKNHLQFLDDEGAHAYYLLRPAGGASPVLDRAWNYLLYKGNQPFDVGKEHHFRICRNQSEACIDFIGPRNDFIFTLEWAGKGDVGGLAAGSKEHHFYWKGSKFMWSPKQSLTGTDYVCTNTSTGDVAAYFKAVLRPQLKEGKLEIADTVDDEELEIRLVATCIAYRGFDSSRKDSDQDFCARWEWSIRRTMLMFGESYFSQSVTG